MRRNEPDIRATGAGMHLARAMNFTGVSARRAQFKSWHLARQLQLALTLAIGMLIVVAPVSRGGATPNVVASIKPVHALVAAVMEGVGKPALIVDGAGSPHDFALKPSQAREVASANLIFWVGHDLEAFLEKPIATLGNRARAVALLEAPGLTRLAFRDGDGFEGHDHDDESQDDNHEHEKADDHGGKHGEDHAHAHDGTDPHIWLDPQNAMALVTAIRDELVKTDPDNAQIYAANTKQALARLEELMREIDAALAPVRDRRFIVFHDAYRYFEQRFGLSAAGSITISPEVAPGARRIGEIRQKVRTLGAVCVFSEPQFEPKLVSVITEGTGTRTATLDPLGATFVNGPDLYFEMMRQMTTSFAECLHR